MCRRRGQPSPVTRPEDGLEAVAPHEDHEDPNPLTLNLTLADPRFRLPVCPPTGCGPALTAAAVRCSNHNSDPNSVTGRPPAPPGSVAIYPPAACGPRQLLHACQPAGCGLVPGFGTCFLPLTMDITLTQTLTRPRSYG